MADKKSKPDWFLTERTHALAVVHLTRRPDLEVAEVRRDMGLDLIVSINRQAERPTVRQFGVTLKGTVKPVTPEYLNRVLRPSMQSFRQIGGYPYPVCLFYFTMADDQGYYTWIAEPLVTGDGKPKLELHGAADCRLL